MFLNPQLLICLQQYSIHGKSHSVVGILSKPDTKEEGSVPQASVQTKPISHEVEETKAKDTITTTVNKEPVAVEEKLSNCSTPVDKPFKIPKKANENESAIGQGTVVVPDLEFHLLGELLNMWKKIFISNFYNY